MKKLTAKQYLDQLQDIDINIDQEIHRLQAMRMNATGGGAIRYDLDKVQTSPQDRLCDDICNIVTYEDQIDKRVDAFVDAKEKIISQIRGLHNSAFNQVLFKVYVEYKSLKETAIEMHRCYAYVRDKHKEALAAFEENYPDLHYLT